MEKQSGSLNDFTMLTMIGVGNYAKVVLVRKKVSARLYAMKIVKKKDKVKNPRVDKQHAYIQKQILLLCDHPFIAKLYSAFQHKSRLYYILQYCPGGQLFGMIKRHKRFSEETTRFYASQILMALEYLHNTNIIYRDLKPENVLIDHQGYIRLVDFGISAIKGQSKTQRSIAGTPQYLAPESFCDKQNSPGYEADWWCLGSIIFEMAVGFPPFFSQNQDVKSLKHKIEQEEPPLYLINSPVLKDLLSRLLDKEPSKRLGNKGSQEVKKHPWFKIAPWEKLLQKQMKAPFVPKLKSDHDVSWFDLQGEQERLTPSDEDKESVENYNEFSLSWRSSENAHSPSPDASPPQISFNIQEHPGT